MEPGAILAAVLTLMVFSYLAGPNPLYRLAQHIFVGVSVGYAVMLLVGNYLVPRLFTFMDQPGTLSGWLIGLPILLGLVLLLRLLPGAAGGRRGLSGAIGTIVLNIALSTAAALALGGALTGTIVPQTADTMRNMGSGSLEMIIGNIIVVVGVIAALFYFRFGVGDAGGRAGVATLVANGGRVFILIALGAVLGSLSISFVGALVDRVAFLLGLLGL